MKINNTNGTITPSFGMAYKVGDIASKRITDVISTSKKQADMLLNMCTLKNMFENVDDVLTINAYQPKKGLVGLLARNKYINKIFEDKIVAIYKRDDIGARATKIMKASTFAKNPQKFLKKAGGESIDKIFIRSKRLTGKILGHASTNSIERLMK